MLIVLVICQDFVSLLIEHLCMDSGVQEIPHFVNPSKPNINGLVEGLMIY